MFPLCVHSGPSLPRGLKILNRFSTRTGRSFPTCNEEVELMLVAQGSSSIIYFTQLCNITMIHSRTSPVRASALLVVRHNK